MMPRPAQQTGQLYHKTARPPVHRPCPLRGISEKRNAALASL